MAFEILCWWVGSCSAGLVSKWSVHISIRPVRMYYNLNYPNAKVYFNAEQTRIYSHTTQSPHIFLGSCFVSGKMVPNSVGSRIYLSRFSGRLQTNSWEKEMQWKASCNDPVLCPLSHTTLLQMQWILNHRLGSSNFCDFLVDGVTTINPVDPRALGSQPSDLSSRLS